MPSIELLVDALVARLESLQTPVETLYRRVIDATAMAVDLVDADRLIISKSGEP